MRKYYCGRSVRDYVIKSIPSTNPIPPTSSLLYPSLRRSTGANFNIIEYLNLLKLIALLKYRAAHTLERSLLKFGFPFRERSGDFSAILSLAVRKVETIRMKINYCVKWPSSDLVCSNCLTSNFKIVAVKLATEVDV